MPQGQTAIVAITVVPRLIGSITNQVVVGSPYADPANATLTSRMTVVVVEKPVLEYERQQNKLLIGWPVAAGEFILETTDNLASPAGWTEEKNTRVIVDGRVTVTIKMSTGLRYYRLRTP